MDHPLFTLRRRFMLTAAGFAAALAVPGARAQSDFPKGPVRIIVPLSAGGAADIAARAIAAALEKQINQPVIVDNKPGGSSTIAMQALLSAPPDGHTLLSVNTSMASAQVVRKQFDMNKQLQLLTVGGESPLVLAVNPQTPYKTMKDLIEAARANPGKISYGTVGIGSNEHLAMMALERANGVQFLHVPYKGGPDVIKGLIGGEIEFTQIAAIFAVQYAPKGQVRVLAVFEPQRLKELPDVPAIGETGVQGRLQRVWTGFAVHANTPAPIARRLYDELAKAVTAPSVVEKLSPFGMVMYASKTPDDFRRFIDSETKWMAELAKDIKVEPN